VAATCVDVTDAGEATTVDAGAAAFAWSPAEITAKVGDVITWTNGDSVGHRVATDDGSCRMASNIRGGGSRSLRFTTAGEYAFHCTVHPSMTGTLIITE
jgi:plastocyanin